MQASATICRSRLGVQPGGDECADDRAHRCTDAEHGAEADVGQTGLQVADRPGHDHRQLRDLADRHGLERGDPEHQQDRDEQDGTAGSC